MLWTFLILIFIRPFISSLAFPCLNAVYSTLLLIFLSFWFLYKGSVFKNIPVKYPLLLFCLSLIISLAFSKNILKSLGETYKYATGILLFLTVSSLPNENKRRAIDTIIIAGVIISLTAVYQYCFGFKNLLNYLAKTNNPGTFTMDYILQRRVFFPFVTPDILAGYLSMVIPLTLGNKKRSWFIIPLSISLLLTKSIGAFLSIFLGMLIYFYGQGKFKKREFIFLAGLLIIIGLVFITRASAKKEHLQPAFSAAMRLNYWRGSGQIIKSHPIVGAGLGNFNLKSSRYAHNSYLQIWAEMGILGLLSFLWLIANILKSGLQNIKINPYKNEIIGLTTAAAVFLIHNSIDFSFFLPEAAIIWWAIIGCLFS